MFALILLWCFNKKNNSFNLFLSKNEINKFINDDNDMYLYNLSSADLFARNVENISDYKKNIINNIYTLSNEEKERMIKLYNNANNILTKNYPEIADTKGHIVFIKNNICENGLPHTRSNIIFLSTNLLNDTDLQIIKILIHEKIHIFQRFNPFHKLIIDFLHNNNITQFMTKKDYINTHPLTRANPDLDNWIYINKNNILTCSYNSKKPNSINDIDNDPLYEHPYEMMAYNITQSIN